MRKWSAKTLWILDFASWIRSVIFISMSVSPPMFCFVASLRISMALPGHGRSARIRSSRASWSVRSTFTATCSSSSRFSCHSLIFLR